MYSSLTFERSETASCEINKNASIGVKCYSGYDGAGTTSMNNCKCVKQYIK